MSNQVNGIGSNNSYSPFMSGIQNPTVAKGKEKNSPSEELQTTTKGNLFDSVNHSNLTAGLFNTSSQSPTGVDVTGANGRFECTM